MPDPGQNQGYRDRRVACTESQPEGHQVMPVVTNSTRAPWLRQSWGRAAQVGRGCVKAGDEKNEACKVVRKIARWQLASV